ncbi:putative bifunctional diguanylate cyclase/phosphodiesterase [Terrisporobacter mayombei]|uniref:Uncharacterized protein n=1 Tax=Terrisporobacter mayombei TaxID=1541 RepID=A0ABY9PWN3_9FIRM|nr:bifunctional diguanylate cyclase/phosphodiesterase [Terrisporobacter mayombei]MCC3867971.1 bifunctional diguanylate cyclase/phosphodiesterase [Terrisporobacter mayombei]WMT80105.1 hypothetical protein TEMA_04180 [Terrisporobacter mayombei]
MENKIDKIKLYKIYIGIIVFLVLLFSYPSTNIYYKIITNTMGILGCITSIFLVCITFKRSEKNKLKNYWLLNLLAITSFGIGEIIWAIKEIFLNEKLILPSLTISFYLPSNIFLFLGSLILLKKNRKTYKTQKSKVSLDMVIIVTMYISIMFASIMPMLNYRETLLDTNIYLILYNILNFMTLINLSIIYIYSNENIIKGNFFAINFLGVLLYALSDLVYMYEILESTYVSNTLLDSLWIISFLLIGLSAIEYLFTEDSKDNFKIINECEDKGFMSYLAIVPIPILFIMDINNKHQAIIGIFISVIVIRQIKVLNENKILVKKYKMINEGLESAVLERTKELHEKNIELNYLSNKDTLTDLYNRRYLLHKLDELIVNSSKDNSKFGILFLDLDKFKNINDLYGHEVGDLLLNKIGNKLQKHSSKNSIIIRQGGDEFVIIYTHIDSEEDLKSFANQIISEFDKEICIEKIDFKVNFSIGGVIYPTDGEDKLTLMKKADMAMYASKKNASSKFSLYKENNMYNKFKMEKLMEKALNNKEFILYYQPQFNIDNNKIVGIEALIRWVNDELGFVYPSEFIPLAEETGLIIDIGNWIIESTFLQIKKWQELYNIDIEVGINVSPIQLSDKRFLDVIVTNLQNTNINPSLINLEITEKIAIDDSEVVIEKLKIIRDLGIKVSIDDFGSGYSSFKYAKSFAVDTLKIDISLIKGIDKSKEDYEIAKAVINMAKGLGLNIVAEGVDSDSQLSVLRNLGCDTIQGYYYEKPMKIEQLEKKYFM